jgi:hypothetical protein
VSVPGDPRWLAAHGIDPEVWRERGVWRYDTSDRVRVKATFREHLPPTKLGTISRVVGQSAGIVMPKFAPPGYDPVIPQLRPDNPVETSGLPKWHYHGPSPEKWPRYPARAGRKHAGKCLSWNDILTEEEADLHVAKARGDRYDPETGYGSHHGENRDDVHRHRTKAKYILLGAKRGDNQRIDLHPLALDRIKQASRVFFALEGCPKNDAIVSAGEAVFSVPSVTLWNPREVGLFAREYLPGKLVIVVPDADWYDNPQVDRQALLVRTCLRTEGVQAEIAAPPVEEGVPQCECKPVGRITTETTCDMCGGYLKGGDDWLGAGGTLDSLTVQLRDAPLDRIYAWARTVTGLRLDRIRRAVRALEGLSLHTARGWDDDLEGPYVELSRPSLARIMGLRTRDLDTTLADLADTFTHTCSLETQVLNWNGRQTRDWIERPRISVRPEFRASFGETSLGELMDERLGRAA